MNMNQKMNSFKKNNIHNKQKEKLKTYTVNANCQFIWQIINFITLLYGDLGHNICDQLTYQTVLR